MTNKPSTYNMDCVQGDDFVQPIRFRDPDTLNPLNLTGWSGSAHVRRTLDDVLVTPFTVTINQPVNPGMVLLELADTVTELMPVGVYNWDLELVNAAGLRRTWLQGTFSILKQYTRIDP